MEVVQKENEASGRTAYSNSQGQRLIHMKTVSQQTHDRTVIIQIMAPNDTQSFQRYTLNKAVVSV